MRALGIERESDIEHGIKKLRKQQKLCSRLNRLISEVEGKKPDSLGNSLRWVKGLLHDFIQQKEKINELERVVEKLNHLLSLQSRHQHKESINNMSQVHPGMLSPINAASTDTFYPNHIQLHPN